VNDFSDGRKTALTGGRGLLCLPLVGKEKYQMNEKKKSVYRLTQGGLLMEADIASSTVTGRQ
jgi:hypothetical protein